MDKALQCVEELLGHERTDCVWAYRTTCKKLTGRTLFRLVYGIEAIMPMEYIVPFLRITTLSGTTDHGALEERLVQLTGLKEDIFFTGFH